MREQSATYLSALFDNKPDNSKILIWYKRGNDKVSVWCDSAESAAVECEKLDGFDVYTGVGLRANDMGPSQRGKDVDVIGLTGVWVDIDIGTAGHKGKNNPPDEASAVSLVRRVELAPSMIVGTGGGIHAYWLFNEVWSFVADDDRKRASDLSKIWQRMMQAHALAAGYAVDSTFDLSRVLRVPGTFNHKTGTPRLCEIRERSEFRYEPTDLRAAIPPEIARETAEVEGAMRRATELADGFVFDPGAQPPFDKFDALSVNEPRFREAFDRKGKGGMDDSPSAWDMALARYAVAARWSDQEIVNLLVTARRRFGDDFKRPDYFRRTIVTARSSIKQREAVEVLRNRSGRLPPPVSPEARIMEPGPVPAAPDPERAADRGKTLDYLSEVLETRIVRVVKFDQDPPRYRVQTSRGAIDVGEVGNLIGQAQFRNAIAASEGRYLPKFKGDDWDAVAQALLDACEVIDTGPEGTDDGQMMIWVRQYLDENQPAPRSTVKIANCEPFTEEDEQSKAFLFLVSFRDWLFKRQNERVGSKDAGRLLRKIGAESVVVRHEDADENPTTRHVWRVPYETRTRANGTGRNGVEPPI